MDQIEMQAVVAQRKAIAERAISSRELLEHYLARIEADRKAINAVVTVDADRARRDAAKADEATARNEVWGPFHGIPVSVKDLFEVEGMRTTAGSEAMSGYISRRDADAVARLRAAGAVIFAKTNTPVFGSHYQTFNTVFGSTNNPWDLERTAGGSSGGSAAAVAAGHSSLDLGSDMGGSVRIPAAWCGVFGHKPTFGTVSLRGEIPPMPGSFASLDMCMAGPLARSAEDLDLALGVLAAPPDADALAWRLELPQARHSHLRDFRVGVWLADPASPVDGEVLEVLHATVEAVAAEGARVTALDRPIDLAGSIDLYLRLLGLSTVGVASQEEYDAMGELLAQHPTASRLPHVRLARNSRGSARDLARAHEERAHLRNRWAEVFRDHDVVLTPITQVTAPPHNHSDIWSPEHTFRVNGEEIPLHDTGWAWGGAVGNLTYLPATVVPVGRSRSGLPVGMQVLAAHLEDRTAIAFARLVSDLLGGFVPPPGR